MSRGKKAHKTVSPNPQVFSASPEALKREATTVSQQDFNERIIRYGDDNAFPLRLSKAVEDSPATSSCIRTISKFIKGAGFSDKDLMKVKVNKQGQTLWDLHQTLSKSLALFEGFAMNFKYNNGGGITNVYDMAFESLRFVKPDDDLAVDITHIKYNAYFGTNEYNEKYTKKYSLYNPESVKAEHKAEGNNYKGQVYYYGTTSPLHRFYPYPVYWSAKEWIESDAKLGQFTNQELENGFFQSVLMNIVGDPNEPSSHPDDQETYIDESDGLTKKRPRADATVGKRFGIEMSKNFSGSKKAGTVMALWSINKENATQIQPFPANVLADRLETQQNLATKNITISTGVMAILANISEGVSLGSGGSELQKAVEIMQSNTVDQRILLEQFYNEILLPNLQVEGQKSVANKKVEIVNYNPITVKVEIEDKIWEWMNDEEKAEFVKKNFPGITLFRTAMSVEQEISPTKLDENGEPLPAPPPPNEALKNINMKQMDRIQNIVARFNIGQVDPTNKKALTYEQAKAFLLSYGLTEQDIPNWLKTIDELTTEEAA